MTKTWGLALLAVLPLGATAQEFRGAEISGEILAFAEDSELGETTYRGSVEFGVFAGVGVQADIAFHDSRTIDLGTTAFALHATYDALGYGTVGAFYARDSIEGSEAAEEGGVSVYGLEGATALGAGTLDLHAGLYQGEEASGRAFGIEGAYEFTPSIAVTGSAAFVAGDIEASRLSVGGQYRFGQGPAVFAEVGRLDGQGEEDPQAFVSLGARLAIGPNGGTTFGPRGLSEVLSGF